MRLVDGRKLAECMSEEKDKEVTKYFQKRVFPRLPEMRAAKARGLFPKSEGWRNVVEHEIVEAEACDILAEELGILELTRRNVNLAASLHDVNKRREIELMRKVGSSGYAQGQADQGRFLKERGYSDEVIELAESVGGGVLLDFLVDPKASELKVREDIPIQKLIVHYVDDIVLNNNIVPLKDRIAYLLTVPAYKELNEAGRHDFNGRTAFEVQFEVSRQIEQRLARMINVDPPESLPDFIKGKIEERIKDQTNSK